LNNKKLYKTALFAVLAMSVMSASAQVTPEVLHDFTSCDASFFHRLGSVPAQTATAPMERQGNLAWFKVKDRKNEEGNQLTFATPMTVGDLKLTAYFDEMNDLGPLGRYVSWGFIAEGSIDDVARKMKPLIMNAERLKRGEDDYHRTEVKKAQSDWLAIDTSSGTVPAPGTVERVFFLEPEEAGKTVRVTCSLQGAVSSEMLKVERPDIAPSDYPVSQSPIVQSPVVPSLLRPPSAATIKPVMSVNPPIIQHVLTVALLELIAVTKPDADIKKRLSKIDQFKFSAETQNKLFALFGNGQPLHMQSSNLDTAHPRLSIQSDLLKNGNLLTNGKIEIGSGEGEVVYDKSYKQSHMNIGVPYFSTLGDYGSHFFGNNLHLTSDSKLKGTDDLLVRSSGKLDSLKIESVIPPMQLAVEGIQFKLEIKQHQKIQSHQYELGIHRIEWGGDHLGPVKFVMRVPKVDLTALAALEQARPKNQPVGDEYGLKVLQTTLKNGIDISEISIVYDGLKATSSGHLDYGDLMSSGIETDPNRLFNQGKWTFNVRVPKEMFVSVVRRFIQSDIDTKNKHYAKSAEYISADVVNMKAKGLVDTYLATLLERKMIKVERGVVIAKFEVTQGKIFANGQYISDFPSH
jgi:hypothetical protein